MSDWSERLIEAVVPAKRAKFVVLFPTKFGLIDRTAIKDGRVYFFRYKRSINTLLEVAESLKPFRVVHAEEFLKTIDLRSIEAEMCRDLEVENIRSEMLKIRGQLQ